MVRIPLGTPFLFLCFHTVPSLLISAYCPCTVKSMDLGLYRRHVKACPHRAKGADWVRCGCPLWIHRVKNCEEIRRSLGTADWAEGVRRAERIINGDPDPAPEPTRVKLAGAIADYLADSGIRGVAPATLANSRHALGALAVCLGDAWIDDVKPADIHRYRAGREISANTHRKELTVFRAFFAWCVRIGTLERNPAKLVAMPQSDSAPTLPLTQDEVVAVLAACDRLDNNNKEFIPYARARARAAILTMLYTGLRVSDVAALRRDAINAKGELFIRTEKTSVALRLPLPRAVIDALELIPTEGEYFFRQTGLPRTTASTIRRAFVSVGKLAGVHLHPHRLRDTFACRMLERGVDIRLVSKALGHSSVRITEKHYSPWMPTHQSLLEAATARLDFLAPADAVPFEPRLKN